MPQTCRTDGHPEGLVQTNTDGTDEQPPSETGRGQGLVTKKKHRVSGMIAGAPRRTRTYNPRIKSPLETAVGRRIAGNTCFMGPWSIAGSPRLRRESRPKRSVGDASLVLWRVLDHHDVPARAGHRQSFAMASVVLRENNQQAPHAGSQKVVDLHVLENCSASHHHSLAVVDTRRHGRRRPAVVCSLCARSRGVSRWWTHWASAGTPRHGRILAGRYAVAWRPRSSGDRATVS
jgi:hypothetical protein